jgi:methylenetetrahydrofolate dehydrogenase (NADP+) / methenyltetrahydrofolate cyclohydrolase
MKLLYGKPIADKILDRLKKDIAAGLEKPGLAVVLVGDDAASKIYVALKEKTAHEIGMNFFRHDLSQDVSESEILGLIQKLNADEKVHGIIVQLPLPKKFNTEEIISTISSEKDADGFSAKSRLAPVFAHAIMLLLESSGEKLENKKAIVIANSDEFGKVMKNALNQKGVLAEHVLAKNLSDFGQIEAADIVVSAVGSPGLLKGEMLKDGAIVVDGGIEKVDGKVVGDVDLASTEVKNGFLTPVPGGVGPVTIACLLENVFLAFKASKRHNSYVPRS